MEYLINPELAQHEGQPSLFAVSHDEHFPRVTSLHQHARGQLLASLHGLITVGMESAQWLIPASHAMWLPPQHPHELRSHGPYVGWSVYVAPSACSALPTVPCTLRLSPLLREAAIRAASWGGLERDALRQSLEAVILGEISTLPVENLGLSMPKDPRLIRVAQALLAHLGDKRSIDAWAKWVGISARGFSRHFRAETGFSFSAWRQRARLMRALALLADGQPVTVIAFEVGYDNVGAFIEMFRRAFGVTPTKYLW